MKMFRRLAMYITSQHPEWVPPDFRDLLDSAPDAMVIVDEKRRIVLINARTEALFGHRRTELLGKPVAMLLPERHHTAYAAQLAACATDACFPARSAVHKR